METKTPGKQPLTVARYLRQFRGLSMMALADKLKLPYMTVFSLEHGQGARQMAGKLDLRSEYELSRVVIRTRRTS